MAEGDRKPITLDDVERRHLSAHLEAYWGWLRLVLSLATGALTVLVGLQGHYVPKHPEHPWMLVCAWALLALSIAGGMWALRWSYAGPMLAAHRIRQKRIEVGDLETTRWLEAGGGIVEPPTSHALAAWLLQASFLAALALLCGFAALNLLR